MTQKEKSLLLQDLCARFPYKVNIQVKEWSVLDIELKIGHINRLQNDDIELKPYLRLMSSMTEEELEEFHNYTNVDPISWLHCAIDWLNSHHFDY